MYIIYVYYIIDYYIHIIYSICLYSEICPQGASNNPVHGPQDGDQWTAFDGDLPSSMVNICTPALEDHQWALDNGKQLVICQTSRELHNGNVFIYLQCVFNS